MDRQPQLQTLLEQLLGDTPELKVRVYFQPPENVTMVFPCIRYERSRGETLFANNHPYRYTQGYEVTVIDEDPNSELRTAVAALPMTVHERWYAANNLNHDVFNTYF